jgi:hypothetical protein
MASNAYDVIFLQETILQAISSFKKKSAFLPAMHDKFEHVDAIGTARGILTSWNSEKFTSCSSIAKKQISHGSPPI